MNASSVAAVIVNWNGGQDLSACIGSLRAQTRSPTEIIVVDNGSEDGSRESAAKHPGITVLPMRQNLGFAGGANAGAQKAASEFLLFLNPDTWLVRDCLEHLVRGLENDSRISIIGPLILNPDESIQNCGLFIDRTGHPIGISQRTTSVPPFFVSGCCLLIRRAAFDLLHGFDTDFFMFAEDLDLCWRAQLRGQTVATSPAAVAYHRGGGSLPGGYIRKGKLVTNARRIYLRERNTLATVIKNYAWPQALCIGAVRVLSALAESAVFLTRGRYDAARAYLAAILWNARHLRRIMEKRRVVQRERAVRDARLVGIVCGFAKLNVWREVGIPAIKDEP